MLLRVGQLKELKNIHSIDIKNKSMEYIEILNAAYGTDRDYLSQGGYILFAENIEDIPQLTKIVDINNEPFEWYENVNKNYISFLYLLGDDFSIITIIPKLYAEKIIKNFN